MPDDGRSARQTVAIVQEGANALGDYARVSIAFEVWATLDAVPADGGLGGLRLAERALGRPYRKDYDADPAHHPAAWAARFDVARWGFLAARVGGVRVGGAAVAWGTPSAALLDGRDDLALLWDLRVAPDARGQGVGAALFAAAERWAAAHGARWLKVETQNVNVAACRFYARQRCTLGAIHRFAYPELPDEVQLLWYKRLDDGDGVQSGEVRGEVRGG